MAPLRILLFTFVVAVAAAGADELTAKLLPGNKPCAYPPEAQRQYLAGPVRFVAHVRPDGTAESVEVPKVPASGLGFEDAIRACVSQWRFEPAVAGGTALRRHEGQIRFRLDVKEEAAIRTLLESLATAWNAGDLKAIEDLAVGTGDTKVDTESRRSIRAQLEGHRGTGTWRMELAPDLDRIRFFEANAVNVRQPFRRVGSVTNEQPAEAEESTLEVYAAKSAGGWRLVSLWMGETAASDPVRVGNGIREPRKVKDARPSYPESMKANRIQGAVILEAVISAEGRVLNVRVLRGVHPRLDGAAIEAVRRWEYTPTLFNGVAVPVIMTVTVNFRLS
jgi:TonB family protein